MRLPRKVVRRVENAPVGGFRAPSELRAQGQWMDLSAPSTRGCSSWPGSQGLSDQRWTGWSCRHGSGHSWSPATQPPRDPAFPEQEWGPLQVPVSHENVGLMVVISQCPAREQMVSRPHASATHQQGIR